MALQGPDTQALYGPGASALLEALHTHAQRVSGGFTDDFYASLLRRAGIQSILGRLDSAEFEQLRRQQASHLAMLVSPGLEALAHRRRALQVGRIHALVGVDMMWLTEAYSLYQRALHQLLGEHLEIPPAARQRMVQLIDRRLLSDLQAQSAGYREIELELAQATALLQQRALAGRNLTDLYQGTLAALCSIDGLAAAFVGRLDPRGRWEVEAYDGAVAPACLAAMQTAQAPVLDAAGGAAHDVSLLSQAWRDGRVRSFEAGACACGPMSWLGMAAGLGLRSCAVVPLVDDTGNSHALLSLHSRWPGFFETASRPAWLEQVQQIIGVTVWRMAQPRVISYARRHTLGGWLDAGRVRMLYQPIIDLHSGALSKVEALARLIDDDARMIGPDEFLPALGNEGLLRLFELGLDVAQADQRAWREAGMQVRVALNLPPQAVDDQRYHGILFRAFDSGRVAPQTLELEILESGETRTHAAREPFFERLRERGVRVVQDDLGSGHSSLLRLDRMPFDEVKIDQALVREAARKDPQRAFAFILHLTQLAHSLNVSVTVEGLEHAGLVEAAAILGADRGQGYGIGKPMPAQSLREWLQQYRHAVNPRAPVTPWGALAGYLIWDRQLGSLGHWPELVEDFVRSPCLVQRFLDARGMRESRLQRLLDLNHVTAVQPDRAALYRRTRGDIIQALRQLGMSA